MCKALGITAGLAACWMLAPATSYAQTLPPRVELPTLLPRNGGDGSEGIVITSRTEGGLLQCLGDINGDGADDLAINSFLVIEQPLTTVVFGQAGGFGRARASTDELVGLGGDGGLRIVGADGLDRMSVRSAGDVDGDDIGDVFIYAERSDARLYVVFGAADLPAVIPVSEDGIGGVEALTIRDDGIYGQISFGYGLSAVGDVNGDGFDDVATSVANFAGRYGSFVVFGGNDLGGTEVDLGDLAPPPVGAGDGSAGFALETGRISLFAPGGDINGDGIGDFVGTAENNTGFGFLVFGRADGFGGGFDVRSLSQAGGGDGTYGSEIIAPGTEDVFYSTAVGDINGDGLADALFSGIESPDAYLLFGQRNGYAPSFRLDSLLPSNGGDGSEGFVLRLRPDTTPSTISAGDVNLDGRSDVLVREQRGDFTTRFAYLLYGSDAVRPGLSVLELFPETGGDGTAGVVFDAGGGGEVPGPFSNEFRSVLLCDLDGDGVKDFVGADDTADELGLPSQQAIYVYYLGPE